MGSTSGGTETSGSAASPERRSVSGSRSGESASDRAGCGVDGGLGEAAQRRHRSYGPPVKEGNTNDNHCSRQRQEPKPVGVDGPDFSVTPLLQRACVGHILRDKALLCGTPQRSNFWGPNVHFVAPKTKATAQKFLFREEWF